jgi:alpha-tubulin suppressor-like RCC1 family protein
MLDTGYGHSIFLTKAKQVYVCGGNSFGQLGTGGGSGSHTPIPMDLMTGCISLVAGAAHSFFIMENGDVYAVRVF